MISNNDLIKHLIQTGALYSKNIIEAFESVDRADFVRNPSETDIYADHPLSIGKGQTISQPTTVAMMMEMLAPKRGEKILDIGSGSGWTTAILACIVGDEGSVIGLERLKELVLFGNENLQKYRFKNAKIIQSGEKLGIKNEMFDRILVSASADEFPNELTNQLRLGGKLVIPVKNSIYEINKMREGEILSREHFGFTFVPLII